MLTILLACNLFTACNDDEGGGVPVIHHIRLVDPEKADSTFTDVNPVSYTHLTLPTNSRV